MNYRPIQRLLIANRGEIAVRVARSARALGLGVITVHTPQDERARHASAGDLSARVDSYLDAGALVLAARRAGADAVHPGYGFLSENAGFARAVLEAGLVWVGPPPDAIAAMGSKTEARSTMAKRGVPVLAGSDSGDDEALCAQAARIGFPVLVKASAGGGGKGMRVVSEPDALPDALAEARRLAAAAFGDDRVFLERYVPQARHVEVQVLADRQGHTIHLWERECSIQRRHQKVIEEAPCPAFLFPGGEERRALLCGDAVRAAEAVGYVGAGTVEFILDERGAHHFLEMNTRIQVEHPVTEAITGLDLVALQIRIAEGRPLPEALRAGPPPPRGWAIEARLYAEDPESGWLPGAGTLLAWAEPEGARVDAGVGPGDHVGIHYDPMLAKVVAWGEDREQARLKLRSALERTVALGLPTNRALLIRALEHPDFAAGVLHTRFLERYEADLQPERDAAWEREVLAAAVVAGWLERRKRAPLPGIPSGWRNNPLRLQQIRFELNGTEREVAYEALDERTLRIDGALVRVLGTDPLRLEIDGLARALPVALDRDQVWVHHPRCGALLRALPDNPEPRPADELGGGHVFAPMPGRVTSVRVSAGERVDRGAVLVVLEAMKMEQPLRAAAAGLVVAVRASAGEQVEAGSLLVVLEVDREP